LLYFSGLECLPAVNLPAGCFCTSGLTPTPYLPLTDLLDAIETKGEGPVSSNVTFRQFVTWTVKENNLVLYLFTKLVKKSK
jgi:hypothetical protein